MHEYIGGFIFFSAKIGFKPDQYSVSENDNSVKVIVYREGNKNGKNTCRYLFLDTRIPLILKV